MPITPFHLGPGLLIKSAAPRWFSFRVFVLANVLIDAEPLYFAFTGQYPLHRFFHSYVGATLVAVVCVAVGRPLCRWSTQVWNRMFARWRISDTPIPMPALLTGAFLGAYGQVVLDSIMHGDMRPFAPWSADNPLLSAWNLVELHAFCVLTGVAGAGIYAWRRFGAKRFLVVTGCLLLAAGITIGSILYFGLFAGRDHGMFDDGPFQGRIYEGPIAGRANSAITLDGLGTLEMYNGGHEETPLMVLRGPDGAVRWARLLSVEDNSDYANTKVFSVTLNDGYKSGRRTIVKGLARWTYGGEAATFYLGRDGGLEGFYLSW